MTQDNADADPRKGRPTPSRKEAEAARKKAMKTPLTRKEQARRDREARRKAREKQQEALRSGSGDHLPPRDRGPVRTFTRDYVDRRRNIAEYLLPILVVAFISSFVPITAAQFFALYAWTLMLIMVIVDEVIMARGLKRELALRFPDESHKGAVGYAVLRTTQLRRFRLPATRVERGAEPPHRY